MALSHLLSLAEEMQEPRSPMYDFGLGVNNMARLAPSAMGFCPCASPMCPASPIGQLMTARHHRGQEMSKKMTGHQWPMTAVGKDGFQACMDVTQFKPSELNVKVVDNCIVVEGKHEERQDDHGYISRHFVRRYKLPQGYDPDKVMSSLSSDGVLTVNVPKPQPIEDKSKARIIQIQQVGPAHLNVKQNAAIDEEKTAANGTKKK